MSFLTTLCEFQSYQFRQIYPDKRIECTWTRSRNGFQSYQFRQIYPDAVISSVDLKITKKGFNRINSGRSIPTFMLVIFLMMFHNQVSIVSIQADLSRLNLDKARVYVFWTFQSYQFRQIYPDEEMSLKCSFKLQGFQSYQFRQIYPDANNLSH